MPSLKEVRNRIQSIQSTRKITSAMKMVAASRLHKSQLAIRGMRRYSAALKQVLDHVNRSIPFAAQSPFMRFREGSNPLVVSIASNKGLCGTYNALLIKKTLEHLRQLTELGHQPRLLLIGKKNETFFTEKAFPIDRVENHLIDKLDFSTARAFAHSLMQDYLYQNYVFVDVVYHRFHNAVVQELTTERILPVPAVFLKGMREEAADEFIPYILEPSAGRVVEKLVPEYIECNLFRMLLDASASEHGARMTAMHKATDNADELLKQLSLSYNKARQALITREITEIAGSAEALSR